MPTRLVSLVIDAADPPALAEFWAAALAWTITPSDPEVVVAPPADDPSQRGQVPLCFVPVTEPKVVKNRIHLDVASRSAKHQAALVSRMEGLGARRVDVGQGPDVSWVVMADPEGNEYCVVSHAGSVGADPSSAFGVLHPIAAIVLDSPDPEAIAEFWSAATAWPTLGRDGTHVWLRDRSQNGPYLDIRQNNDPKTTKLRVHLDIAPFPDDPQPPELTRLQSLGATPIDINQGTVYWHVLADPQGNELCLLTPR